ncbi:FN3 domain-containing metallophosphoesterase family protein [Prosthecobacter sp.]|uniref:FN3 domain-containing metallophosphoesterase family protein n=1 Tax=Prosthecobacter sp. TaxID=1965333 RepID=UPI002AB9EB66|nr:FN3 domain-containing metallophosphoesterase family protein [Prosthecobacter sp.]MDZ4402031.1 FN3 domain-containing metallophosphoesterase family protein [Prosthecobacter sp.]
MIRPLLLLAATTAFAAPIERIWLTHATSDPSKIIINWETDTPNDSVVEFGTSEALGQRVISERKTKLHHVKIPLEQRDVVYHYRVRSGDDVSTVSSFKGYPSKDLRIAIVGDWGYAPGKDVSAIIKDDVHLLLTVGDNVASLHEKGKEGTKAFSALIDANRDLFRRTPFMPILGNHDREITGRGPKPPAHAVYDVEAAAYREFFALPGDEWKWHFDLSGFDLRFIALDLNHIQDFGTTWQTCHAWQPDSPQFQWFAETMAASTSGFVLTLMNEKQTQVQGLTKGAWHEHFRKGSALITGFGYFADRAELSGGPPYYNTCLKGDGDLYKDPQSKFHARVDNYLLLTITAGAPTMKLQFKNLRGEVLDTTEIAKRKP